MNQTSPIPEPRISRVGGRIWLLIALACTVPALISIFEEVLKARLFGQAVHWQDVVFSGSEWLFLGGLTPITYQLNRRFPLSRKHWAKTLGIHAGGALLLCLGWASLGVLLGVFLHHYPVEGSVSLAWASWILTTLPYAVFMYFSVLGCLFAIDYFNEAREREAQASQLMAQLAEARLGALRMQLNPHFLYNSLNAVSVLVRDQDAPAATRMLALLGDVLRRALRSDQPTEVLLKDELSFLEHYLDIEQVRFSDRLRVQWQIEDRATRALVPSFILQPIVENAIKHGLAKRADAGKITIAARVIDDILEILISDDGPGLATPIGSDGVGLANTRERLRTMYGVRASVDLSNVSTGGAEARLVLPFKEVTD